MTHIDQYEFCYHTILHLLKTTPKTPRRKEDRPKVEAPAPLLPVSYHHGYHNCKTNTPNATISKLEDEVNENDVAEFTYTDENGNVVVRRPYTTVPGFIGNPTSCFAKNRITCKHVS